MAERPSPSYLGSKNLLMVGPAVLALLVVLLFLLGGSSFSPAGSSGRGSAGASPREGLHVTGSPRAFQGYNVTFVETGLTTGTEWNVTYNSVTQPSTTTRDVFFPIPNGTYTFTVQPAGGLVPTPASGYLNVSGSRVFEHITFTAAAGTYQVTFTETGLTGGTPWGVTFNGAFYAAGAGGMVLPPPVKDGNYPWNTTSYGGLVPTPANGTITVSGAPTGQNIAFAPPPPPKGQYTVTFYEGGLPAGTSWSVFFNGSTHASATPAITIGGVLNGSYPWNVTAVPGYNAAPASATMLISGANNVTDIVFTAIPGTYTASIRETGLPPGTTWSVDWSGTVYGSGGTARVTITGVTNGSYTWSVVKLPGYAVAPPGGIMNITGANNRTSVVFTAIPGEYGVDFTETGLPGGTSWSVTFNGSTGSAIAPALVTFTGFANGSYPFTVGGVAGYTSNPSSGSVQVNGTLAVEAITFTPLPPGEYQVTFSESGLPAGTSWSVTFNSTLQTSTTTTDIFTVGDGSYTYTVSPVTGYVANPSSGPVTVSGASKTIDIVFSTQGPGHYSVTFSESGLPTGTSWSVTFNDTPQASTTSTDVFSVLDGSYNYTVGAVAGYSPSPSSGPVTVSGKDQTISITFTPVAPGQYAITFSESGLPTGTHWSVTFNNTPQSSTTTTDVFTVPDGSYSYTVGAVSGYLASPASGSVKVNGAAQTIPITFTSTAGLFSVSFVPSDLPSLLNWSVTVNNVTTQSSAGGTITFWEPNGSLYFSLGALSGFELTPSSGKLTVTGAPVSQPIVGHELFSVSFTESGLPSGDTWKVTFNGTVYSGSSGSAISLNAINGSYPYSVSGPSGYTGSPASGTASVSGAPFSKGISFSSTSSSGNPLTSGSTLYLILIIVLVAIVAIVAALMLSRRKSTGPAGPYADAAMAGAGATYAASTATAAPPGGAPPASAPAGGPAPTEESTPAETPTESPASEPAPAAEEPASSQDESYSESDTEPSSTPADNPPPPSDEGSGGDAQWPPPA